MKLLKKNVLVAVVKSRNDLTLLKQSGIYRIPEKRIPKLSAEYIAFYQPRGIAGKKGGIKYYGKISGYRIVTKQEISDLLVKDSRGGKPGGDHAVKYHLIKFKKIRVLRKKIRNISGMRISFGRTALKKLETAKYVYQLFDINPVEDLFEKLLKKYKIKYKREYPVYENGKLIFRLDYLVEKENRKIAVECDSTRWHSKKSQRIKDKIKTEKLKALGYTVLRFNEEQIVNNVPVIKKELS